MIFVILKKYILCLPGTTASVQRIFSIVYSTWAKEKSRLSVLNYEVYANNNNKTAP